MSVGAMRAELYSVFVKQDRVSPLTASLAWALMKPTDGFRTMAVCWWLATKFEELTYLSVREMLEVFPEFFSKTDVLTLERHVLQRFNFVLPFRTVIRSIMERIDVDTNLLHSLQQSGLIHLFSADDWVYILTSLAKGTVSHSIFWCIPKRLRRSTFRAAYRKCIVDKNDMDATTIVSSRKRKRHVRS